MLLQLPAPFASFVTVKIPLPAKGSTAPARQSAAAEAFPQVNDHTARLHKLASEVLIKQPGGPLVAYPNYAGQCQVVCPKVWLAKTTGGIHSAVSAQWSVANLLVQKLWHLQTAVGSVYKSLKAQQSQLQIKMPDVKSSVSLSPLSNSELEAAFCTAVQAMLTRQGWSLLKRQHFLDSSIWTLEAGKQEGCQSVRLSVTCCAPATVVVQMQTGRHLQVMLWLTVACFLLNAA